MFGLVRFVIHVILSIIEFFLAMRFILVLFGANPATPFVAWIYEFSVPFVRPFAHIFPNVNVGGFVIDSSVLVALIIYSLIGSLMMQIFSVSMTRN